MDHTGGPDVITGILYVGSKRLRIREVIVKMEAKVRERFEELHSCMENGKSQECRLPLEDGIWKQQVNGFSPKAIAIGNEYRN